MSFDEKSIPVQNAVFQSVKTFFTLIARLFGYPKNPGIPIIPDFAIEENSRSVFLANLPQHKTVWPPLQRPENLFEMIFGPTPKPETIARYSYESSEEGFYNFYIGNYKNLYFLPDWLSEFIQVRLHLCLDLTLLETFREIIFLGLMVYSQVLILRIGLSWFPSINPYKYPYYYFCAVADWAEELFQGVIPAVLGVNVTGTVVLGFFGIMADSLNHLVFTMPYLPSEGEETKLSINSEMKDVIVFHYLPSLWYRYPIPNEIRKFWYQERPDILNYMQNAYPDLGIQFLPDQIVKELNQQKVAFQSISSISTEILSKGQSIPNEEGLHFLETFQDSLSSFIFHSFENFF